jgi:phosphoglycerate kinase
MDAKTVRDVDVAGHRVFVRADLNVPLEDGRITDDTRIRASLPTIINLLEREATVVLASHLGRPKGKIVDPLRLRPVAERLSQLLGRPVRMTGDALGPGVQVAVEKLRPGDMLLLENLRFHAAEEANDPAFAESLAGLADLYVNDAFGAAHRAHATTAGVAERLPAYAGLLLEREVRELTAVAEEPARPLVLVLGGAKVSDKIGVISRFLELADEILIGGAMCFSFFRAQGIPTGDSLVEDEGVELARDALEAARDSSCQLRFPVDLVIGDRFDAGAERREQKGVEVPAGWMGLDVGPATARRYAEAIATAGSVFWNGPMGAFELEPFAAGTRAVAGAVAAAPGTTVVGGGDSVAALQRFGLAREVDWLSTGGGASLELLEGKRLPGVEALMDADDRGPARGGRGSERAR